MAVTLPFFRYIYVFSGVDKKGYKGRKGIIIMFIIYIFEVMFLKTGVLHMYTYINTYIHTYIYIYISTYVYIYRQYCFGLMSAVLMLR